MTLEHGKYYVNKRGDELGPMNERVPRVFFDQYDRPYHPNGRQWDHTPDSTGNIIAEKS